MKFESKWKEFRNKLELVWIKAPKVTELSGIATMRIIVWIFESKDISQTTASKSLQLGWWW